MSKFSPSASQGQQMQQLQQDPNDPTRFQILNICSPSGNIEMVAPEEDSMEEKPRSRRVACTCPNCSEGGERSVGLTIKNTLPITDT